MPVAPGAAVVLDQSPTAAALTTYTRLAAIDQTAATGLPRIRQQRQAALLLIGDT